MVTSKFCFSAPRYRSRSSIASCTSVSTQTASDDQVVKFWDELSLVGLPDDIDVQALFEPTGKMRSYPFFPVQ